MSSLETSRFDRSLGRARAPFRGRVRFVFAHSALVEPDQGRFWLALVHPDRALVPWSVAIPWDRLDLTVGDPVQLDPGGLCLTSASGEVLRLRLTGPGVTLRMRRTLPMPGALALRKATDALALPARTRRLLNLGDPAPQADDLARLAAAALRSGNGHSAPAMAGRGFTPRRTGQMPRSAADEPPPYTVIMHRLLGLGPGATPTGDDLLAGVAAGLQALRAARLAPASRVARYARALRALPLDQTTLASREMLRHASRGAFPEPLLEVLGGLFRGAPCNPALRRLCRHGAQSGSELLAGAAAVIKTWTDIQGGLT